MAHVLADVVQETTRVEGTGNATLLGAVTACQAFSSVLAQGDTCWYRIRHRNEDEWEIGLGTYDVSANTIARTEIYKSSNADAAVDFSAGTKDIYIVQPADRILAPNAAGTQYLFSDGSAAAPSIARTSDPTDGVFFGDDFLAVSIDGTEVSRWDYGSTGTFKNSRGFSWSSGVLTTPASGGFVDFDGTNIRHGLVGTGAHKFYNGGLGTELFRADASAINVSSGIRIDLTAARVAIGGISDTNNQGIRLGDNTTAKLHSISQNSSGEMLVSKFDGSAWAGGERLRVKDDALRVSSQSGSNSNLTLAPEGTDVLGIEAQTVGGGGNVFYNALQNASHIFRDGSGNQNLQVHPDGYILAARTSAFLAIQSARVTNVTGDDTAYTVIFDTEVFDQKSNYNNTTGVFTAPVTGRYRFSFQAGVLDFGAAHTYLLGHIVTSNRSYRVVEWNTAAGVINGWVAGNQFSVGGSILCDMDAGDTAYCTVRVAGSTKTVDVEGGANNGTYFSGELAA